MGLLKRIRVINTLRKNGGTFNFEHKITGQKHRIQLTKKMFRTINKYLRRYKNKELLIDNQENVQILTTIDVQRILQVENIEHGELYIINNTKFVVFNQSKLYELFDSVSFEEESSEAFDIVQSYLSNSNNRSSVLDKKKSSQSKPRFDWDEAYMEGLRIFGDIEDAEGYADEQKKKFFSK